MSGFTLAGAAIALPTGAFARTERRLLRHDGRPILALTQGRLRPYLFPLFTPAGFLATSESPADHPHHNSCWIAADHVCLHMPAAQGGTEDYVYNFYVDETFQGRAPGRLIETGCRLEPYGALAADIIQTVEWRGPAEWAAPDGRAMLTETRRTRVRVEPGRTIIDVASELASVSWAMTLGPTRHAYFNVRAADTMTTDPSISDDRGDARGRLPGLEGAKWVHFAGPVGGGHQAGLAVFPHPADHEDLSWFVADWGVVTVGPFRRKARRLEAGQSARARYRLVVHDGALDVAAAYSDYLAGEGSS